MEMYLCLQHGKGTFWIKQSTVSRKGNHFRSRKEWQELNVHCKSEQGGQETY